MTDRIKNNQENADNLDKYDFGSYLYGYDSIKRNAIQAIFKDDKLQKVCVDGKTIDFSSENKFIKEVKNMVERFFNFNLKSQYN